MFQSGVEFNQQLGGWIEVVCGPMFSGKTEELIRRMRRAQIAGQKIEIFKPSSDIRYDDKEVVSHDKNSIPSTPIESSSNILLLADDVQVVGIDEAQFFDEGIIEVANTLANQGKRVVVAGLDLDFMGRPFGPMPHLLATAEYVTKLHAICRRTGGPAHYSFRKVAGDQTFMLGETHEYEPVSRVVYNQLNAKKVGDHRE
ncbi:MAG TPA: thymidine kinase [Cryomorphaceae bacterium]|nr:thymidine kinase [Cryomorphaceae bacterium]HCY24642.1 thymidine kinase [Cryomorphaceae bacterium]|tara:strand:+ start:911 stop:1510 length:600 start_codon:yes stop_codon:yes gene_type:complete